MPFSRVCVYAGSSPGVNPAYVHAASALAVALARRGAGVVFGGGSLGLMGALADASLAEGNDVIGVIPRFLDEREVAHRGTELRVVETMHERKMLMADLADAFVVLPGGIGTLEEVVEMLSWSQLGLHRKPIGLLDAGGYWGPLLELIDHAIGEGFVRSEHRELVLVDEDPDALLEAMEAWEAPDLARWLQTDEET
ncbi:MAG TPA: TIGR00730 family Rossman fold protein [Baekduia sp.]|nr:TIGR00730 family Rossman fold protein [Baekduia sp.]